jgi:hypothetical protein
MGLLIVTQDYRRRKQIFLISDAEKFSPFFGKNSPLAILVEKELSNSFRRLEICYSRKSLLRRILCKLVQFLKTIWHGCCCLLGVQEIGKL